MSEKIPEEEWARIKSFFERLVDAGWKPHDIMVTMASYAAMYHGVTIEFGDLSRGDGVLGYMERLCSRCDLYFPLGKSAGERCKWMGQCSKSDLIREYQEKLMKEAKHESNI